MDSVAVPAPPQVGLQPGGGGFYIRGGDYALRLLGYVQANATVYDGALDRPDGHGDFFLRRARLDFIATFFEKYTLFIEIDGAGGTATPADSDFGLIIASLNWKIAREAVQLRAGKFIVPASAENLRSSRSLETVERYLALNSLFLIPALDVQFGAMVHGQLGPEGRVRYYAGLFNGNGRASANFSDNNGAKQLVTRLAYVAPSWRVGASADYSLEEAQTLSLADLGFNRYAQVPVEGARRGLLLDGYASAGRFNVRGEGLAYRFDTPAEAASAEVGLYGGYVQPGLFLRGSAERGVQLLGRLDVAHLDDAGDGGDTIYALLGGLNWYVNPNVRVQVNGVAHYFDGPSAPRGFEEARVSPMLQTELQFKF